MAKVSVEYDTKSKACKASVDGKCVANMHSMHFEKRYSEAGSDKDPGYYFGMSQVEKDGDHDMTTHHRTMAAEQVPEGLEAADSPLVPGLKVVTESECRLRGEIEKYLSRG